MGMDRLAAIKRITEAKVFDKSAEMEYGKFRYEIQRVIIYSGDDDTYLIAEFLITAATATVDIDPDTNKPVQLPKVGSTCSLKCKLNDKSGPGNALKFICAAFDEPEEAMRGDAGFKAIEEITNESPTGQPARFMSIDVEVFPHKLKEKGKRGNYYFKMPKWTHVPPDMAAINAKRAANPYQVKAA